MHQREISGWLSVLTLMGMVLSGGASVSGAATDVAGIVRMPDACSPSVSPAVVYLMQIDANESAGHAQPGDHACIAGSIRFRRRLCWSISGGCNSFRGCRAIALGQTVRFTNQDGETHNVHVVSPGFAFNQSMAPGQFRDFTPPQPGVMRLACDIHHPHAGASWS